VFPILVTTPRYLAGAITLGGLMQIGQAFQQLTAALSWPIDNFPRIADWRASSERVLGLHAVLNELSDERGDGAHIAVRAADAPDLRLRGLCITDLEGRILLDGLDTRIQTGERVLVSGDVESAQLLFRVLAGTWPWGHGAVDLPRDASMAVLPQRAYMPCEPLRRVITWPHELSAPIKFRSPAWVRRKDGSQRA
jgi:vitamin B12/bleomycin/antimicrobial peptide transport system ATP-binding/permease protein